MSFVGGGTDLPAFYKKHPGRVLSATIDKFVYVLINPTPLIDKFTVKYQKTEFVSHPSELEHTRIKAALLDLNFIQTGIEIGSFADLPAKIGLGSSSSFSVALLMGLHAYTDKILNKTAAAEAACHLEIDLLKEPVGKQDQYAASFGGFNIFQFNSDGSVDVEPIRIDHKKRIALENHLLLFSTGITRPASSVLSEQRSKIEKKFNTYKKVADSVYAFREKLLNGDLKGIATMLHEGWLRKRGWASNVSNTTIDELYKRGLDAGAWGGKILGAGGGGCLLLLAGPEKHNNIRNTMKTMATQNQLTELKEIPVKFINSGTDILFRGS